MLYIKKIIRNLLFIKMSREFFIRSLIVKSFIILLLDGIIEV
jgi:hypothetical protein